MDRVADGLIGIDQSPRMFRIIEGLDDMVMAPGDLLVLPPGVRCRAYRWPRDAAQATLFLAAYSPANRSRTL
jgi:ribosomal protein L16 Arg81 hydroxylase